MIIRNYDGTLNGLYDIVWEMSLRITELSERLETVEGELIKKNEEHTESEVAHLQDEANTEISI